MSKSDYLEACLPPTHLPSDLDELVAAKIGVSIQDLPDYSIVRRSIDARRKNNITVNYVIRIGRSEQLRGLDNIIKNGYAEQIATSLRPVVIGFGPAGMFAALYLAKAGFKPLVIERGQKVDRRQKDVDVFWQKGLLNENSNVQFGEGGAGTFSDGKLTTRIKDPHCRAVLEELVLAGAPAEILYLAKPHIGTDILKNVVRLIREKIIELGGEIRFGCQLIDIDVKNNQLQGLIVSDLSDANGKQEEYILANKVILAPGHSARDTFKMLKKRGITLAAKAFAMGMRIEHPQSLIDRAQYGEMAGQPALGPAEYKLAVKLPSGRSVYSFCMCPGGEVILASSEKGGIVTNGMSFHDRNLPSANSALLVGVSTDDFISESPLAGIDMQRRIEQKVWDITGGVYAGAVHKVRDFVSKDQLSKPEAHTNGSFHTIADGSFKSSCRPEVREHHPSEFLPSFIWRSIAEAIPQFDRKIHGFAWGEAVLTGPETRSSSPVRIIRDKNLQSSAAGLVPCGEGAGYAGGIMSAAVDGIRCAQAISML